MKLLLVFFSLSFVALSWATETKIEKKSRLELFFSKGGLEITRKTEVIKNFNKEPTDRSKLRYLLKQARIELLEPPIKDKSAYQQMDTLAQSRYEDKRNMERNYLAIFIRKSLKVIQPQISDSELYDLKQQLGLDLSDDLKAKAGLTEVVIRSEQKYRDSALNNLEKKEISAQDDFPNIAIEKSKGELVKLDQLKAAQLQPDSKMSFIMQMMPAEFKGVIRSAMTESPFSSMSKVDIANMLKAQIEAQPSVEKFFSKNPKAFNAAIAVLHDKNALPSFISIINKPQKTKNFAMSFALVIIIIFILNLKNSNKSILKRIRFKLFLMLGSATANFTLFYFIFHEELTPILTIIKNHLFG